MFFGQLRLLDKASKEEHKICWISINQVISTLFFLKTKAVYYKYYCYCQTYTNSNTNVQNMKYESLNNDFSRQDILFSCKKWINILLSNIVLFEWHFNLLFSFWCILQFINDLKSNLIWTIKIILKKILQIKLLLSLKTKLPH